MRLQQRLTSTPPSAPFGAARLATPAAGEWCADRAGTRDRRRKHITLRNQHQRGFGCAPAPERRDTVPVALWDRSSRSVQPDPASRSSVHDRPHRGRSVRLPGEPRLMLMRAFLIFVGASYARRIVTAHADPPFSCLGENYPGGYARTRNDLFTPAAPGCSRYLRRSCQAALVLGCGKCTCFLACAVLSCCGSVCGRHQDVAEVELQVGRRAPMGVECYGALS